MRPRALLRIVALLLLTGVGEHVRAQALSTTAQSPGPDANEGTVLKIIVGAGGAYETLSLGGALFTGAGPAFEANMDFSLGRSSAWGLGTQYRQVSLIGSDLSEDAANILKISGFHGYAYLRFGSIDVFGGLEQRSSELLTYSSGAAGVSESESGTLPFGGLGLSWIPERSARSRFRSRVRVIYSTGESLGYTAAGIVASASLQWAFL